MLRSSTGLLTLAMFLSPVAGADLWSAPRAITETELEPGIAAQPRIASNGVFVVGAWSTSELGGSVMVQRWTMTGELIDPVARVLRRSIGEEQSTFAVRQVVASGSDFLVLYTQGQTLTIDRIGTDLELIRRSFIEGVVSNTFIHASANEVMLIRFQQADFYTTEGELISTIHDVTPAPAHQTFAIAADHAGPWFLLATISGNRAASESLQTVALHPDGTSRNVSTFAAMNRGRPQLDVAASDTGFLVTSVGLTSDNANITHIGIDHEGRLIGLGTLYETPTAHHSVRPRASWNGSEFDVYWTPPDNLLLLHSRVNRHGTPLATRQVFGPSVIAEPVSSGQDGVLVWIEPKPGSVTSLGVLMIGTLRPGSATVDGRPATWRGQTETDIRTIDASGGTFALWTELVEKPASRGDWESRAAFVDAERQVQPIGLPSDCPMMSMASNGTETAFLWSCGSKVEAAVYDHATAAMQETITIVSDANITLGQQAIAWNGEGWTVAGAERVPAAFYYNGLRPYVLRLDRNLTPVTAPTPLEPIPLTYRVFVASNGQSDLVVTAPVNVEICNFLCGDGKNRPVDAHRFDADGFLVDSATLFTTWIFSPTPFALAAAPEGFMVAAHVDETFVGWIDESSDLEAATWTTVTPGPSSALAISAGSDGTHLARADGRPLVWYYPDGGPVVTHSIVRDEEGFFDVVDTETIEADVRTLALSTTNAGLRLFTEEMTPRPEDGLSFRVFMRELEAETNRRPRGVRRR